MAQSETEEVPDEGPKGGFTREEISNVSIESDDIPIRGSPEEFLILIDELKGSGTRQVGNINEEIDDFGRTNLSANVKYGVNLGFIERTADGIILTEDGVELAYAQDNDEDLSTHFISGLQKEEHYLALLLEFEGDSDYQSQIKNSDVLQVMYTNHDLREEKDTVLKRATSIMFETFELAGYGEVKDASGGLPKRFNFSEDWDTDSVLDELLLNGSDEEDLATDTEESDSQDGEEAEIEDESSFGQQQDEEQGEEATIEEIDELGDITDGKTENGNSGHHSRSKTSDKGVQKVVIDIDLHIDVNEMDSAELEEKIEHINKLIK